MIRDPPLLPCLIRKAKASSKLRRKGATLSRPNEVLRRRKKIRRRRRYCVSIKAKTDIGRRTTRLIWLA